MKKIVVGLVMTAVLSNVVLAAEFESMSVRGSESVQSFDMNDDMLFMNVDGEVMTLEEMEAIEGEGPGGMAIGAIIGLIIGGLIGGNNEYNAMTGMGTGIMIGSFLGSFLPF